jgi:dipeptidyl aminopeptidase/acylaminoacyl peptidase
MIVAAAAPVAYVRTLTLADVRRTVSVASPQISPDGKRIAVLVRRNDYDKDRAVVDLVLVDVRTHAARTLLHDARGISSVEWSPDGTRIAYVADADKESQVFVLPMNGGEPVQLTHEKAGTGDLDWRPDGAAIAYVQHTEPRNQKAIESHADEFEVTDEPWTAQESPTKDNLYEIRASGGAARIIGKGDWSVGGGFTYSADGRAMFVTRITDHALSTRYLAREIVRVDIASGAVTPIRKISPTQADPLRAPDGRIGFSFANPQGTMQTEMALASDDGSNPRSVTFRLDRNVGDASFLPGDAMLVSANDGTQARLFRIAQNGAVSRLPIGTLSITGGQSASRNGTIAFVASAVDRPAELFVLMPGSKAPVRLTNYNAWIDRYQLGKPVSVTWRTFDGLKADGVVLTPPGWHKGVRAPLVLYIHGGPTSASLTAYSSFPQILAAHGWFVFEPNYRGSDNLGLRFARTTVPHISSVPGKDIEAGIAQVVRSFPIDQNRIAVSGWSEGGLMTSWLITHDRRWRAAVSGAAVNDWVQYHDMTDAKDFTPQFIGASPWSSAQQFQFYEDESPLAYASSVRTPTLILSDAGDYRVPTPLAYEFYHEIRATGTPVQFVIYPVVGHFPSDPVRVEDVLRRWEAWLAKYMR